MSRIHNTSFYLKLPNTKLISGAFILAGLTLLSHSALANGCYCPQGHLAGDSCLVPVPDPTTGRAQMRPALKAICPSGAVPNKKPVPTPNLTDEQLEMLYNDRTIELSFNENTGAYGVVVSAPALHPSSIMQRALPKKSISQQDYVRFACISHDKGVSIYDVAENERQYKKNACTYTHSTSILNNRFVFWRAKLPNGKYKAYFYEYHTKQAQNITQREGLAVKAECEQAGKCEFIGEFGEKFGTYNQPL